MKKFIYSLILIASFIGCSAQTGLDMFEVHTRLAHLQPNSNVAFHPDSIMARINAVPDTASTIATFVVASYEIDKVDSIFFTLKNSSGQTVYTGSIKLTAMQGNTNFQRGGNTIYYTVGPYSYLKRFAATARVRTIDGRYTEVKQFAKEN